MTMSADTKTDPHSFSSASSQKIVELHALRAGRGAKVATGAAVDRPRKKAKSKAANSALENFDKVGSKPEIKELGVRRADHDYRSATDHLTEGKALRGRVARHDHGVWKRDKGKVDPLAILHASDRGRLKQLIPIRYGRMLQSPFTFYRGAAAVMAGDLAQSPATGIYVQACGDCHLLN